MTVISVKDVVVDFPLYSGGANRSIKKVIARAATGGILGRDSHERVVVRALNSISFDVQEGDRVGLVGHNGSGKSTLLRLIAGIYEPTQGSIAVKGSVTSMLSISMGIEKEATGLENIYLRGRLVGIPPRKMRAMIDEIVDFAGLGDYLHLPLRTYSSGMAMRLAFAVSTSIEADIILMDEWLSVGDAEFVEKAKRRLGKMVNGARVVILASHNRKLLESQCNKIIRLDHGNISEYSEISPADQSSQPVQ